MSELKIKPGELVLEKCFTNYITPWFHARTVDRHVWNKAQQEVLLLKEKKNKKKKNESLNEKAEHVRLVESLPSDLPTSNDSKAVKERPPSSKSDKQRDLPNDQQLMNRGKKNEKNKSEVELQRVLVENCQLKKEIAEVKNKIRDLRAEAYFEKTERENLLEKLKKALESSRAEVVELTMRLSKLAGDKLRQGNPDLADLSDANRPTELGKRFSEIYDNEWSDAYENIQLMNEDKRVGLLHELIMRSFSFCEVKHEEQTTLIHDVLLGLTQTTPSDVGNQVPVDSDKTSRPIQIFNVLKDLRKQMANDTAKNVANEFLSATFENFVSGFQIEKKKIHVTLRNYAKKCVELCWFMMVCDPPMALSRTKEGMEFDTNVYKPYTKSVRDMKKPVVRILVWPALHLHADAPLVAKGVAQPGEGETK